MLHLREQYLEAMQVKNFSARTLENRRRYIGYFIGWSEQRGLTKPCEITKPILERYQRFLFLYRKTNGDPLTFRTQFGYLVALRCWFKWLAKSNHLLYNPASELELPKLEQRLPKYILTAQEADIIINLADVDTPLGNQGPGHHGDALQHRRPPHGTRSSQHVRHRRPTRHVESQAGQGPEGPGHSHR